MARERADRALSAKISSPSLSTSAKLQMMLDAGTPTGAHELTGWGTSLPFPGANVMIEAGRRNRTMRLSISVEQVTTVRGGEAGGFIIDSPTLTLLISSAGIHLHPKPPTLTEGTQAAIEIPKLLAEMGTVEGQAKAPEIIALATASFPEIVFAAAVAVGKSAAATVARLTQQPAHEGMEQELMTATQTLAVLRDNASAYLAVKNGREQSDLDAEGVKALVSFARAAFATQPQLFIQTAIAKIPKEQLNLLSSQKEAAPSPEHPPTLVEAIGLPQEKVPETPPVIISGRLKSPEPSETGTGRRGEDSFQRFVLQGREGILNAWEGKEQAYLVLVPKDGSVRMPTMKPGTTMHVQVTGALEVVEAPTGNGKNLIERRVKAIEVKKLR